jgi:hypothetical protein
VCASVKSAETGMRRRPTSQRSYLVASVFDSFFEGAIHDEPAPFHRELPDPEYLSPGVAIPTAASQAAGHSAWVLNIGTFVPVKHKCGVFLYIGLAAIESPTPSHARRQRS